MTILNIANDGLPNVYDLMFKYIAKHGPIAEDKLYEKCAPKGICEQKQVRQGLNTWSQLGVFKKDHDKQWQLTNQDITCPKKTAITALMAKKHNINLWSNEFGVDFIRASAWLLAQDVVSTDLDVSSLQSLESQQFSKLVDGERVYLLRNDVRTNGFKSWARYLGLTTNAMGEQIDPTELIRMHLEDIFVDQESLDINVFYQRLLDLLPILDGGHYYLEVTQELHENTWPKPKASQSELSTSLSRALLRLFTEKTVHLPEITGDGHKYQLMYTTTNSAKRVSHITWMKK